jgi:hypothetical protein
MWLEAVVTQADLVKVASELLPARILLDAKGEPSDDGPKAAPKRSLLLHPASQVALVPDEGVQITCPGELTWTFIGMSPTVRLDELRVMLRPRVVQKDGRPVFELGVEVQVADFRALPAFVDEAIVKAVNAALATRSPSWSFTETFARTVPLGGVLALVRSLELSASWGEPKITAEALGLAISLRLGFVRTD